MNKIGKSSKNFAFYLYQQRTSMSNSEKVIVKYAFFSPTLGLSFQMQNQDLIVVDTDGKCENSGTLMDEYYIPSDQSDEDEEDEPIVVAKESVCPSPKKVRVQFRLLYTLCHNSFKFCFIFRMIYLLD